MILSTFMLAGRVSCPTEELLESTSDADTDCYFGCCNSFRIKINIITNLTMVVILLHQMLYTRDHEELLLMIKCYNQQLFEIKFTPYRYCFTYGSLQFI